MPLLDAQSADAVQQSVHERMYILKNCQHFADVAKGEPCLEIFEEAQLLGKEEEEGAAPPVPPTCGTAHAVDVLSRIVGRVVLDDPVHCRDVQPPCCHVSAQEDPLLRLPSLPSLIRTDPHTFSQA